MRSSLLKINCAVPLRPLRFKALPAADGDDDFQLIAVIKHFLIETAARNYLAVFFKRQAPALKLQVLEQLCHILGVFKTMRYTVDGQCNHFQCMLKFR